MDCPSNKTEEGGSQGQGMNINLTKHPRLIRAAKIVEDLFTLRCTVTISDVQIGFGWIVILSAGLAWLVVSLR